MHGSCSQSLGWPQSDGQFDIDSPVSHIPLPHCGQFVQSVMHVWQFSFGSQVPLPQHEPQSAGHVMHVSVPLQVISPQPIAPVDVLDADEVLPDALELAGLPLFELPLPLLDAEPCPEPPLPPSPPSGSMPVPLAHAPTESATTRTPMRACALTIVLPRRALSPCICEGGKQCSAQASRWAPSDRNRR
mgnify:CR=1 FL=1